MPSWLQVNDAIFLLEILGVLWVCWRKIYLMCRHSDEWFIHRPELAWWCRYLPLTNWLRLLVVIAGFWVITLALRLIFDMPHTPDLDQIWIQMTPVVLLFAVEGAHTIVKF